MEYFIPLQQNGGSDLQAIATVVAALGGALLGSFGSYIVERYHEIRRAKKHRISLRVMFTGDMFSKWYTINNDSSFDEFESTTRISDIDEKLLNSKIYETYVGDLPLLSSVEINEIVGFYNATTLQELLESVYIFIEIMEEYPLKEKWYKELEEVGEKDRDLEKMLANMQHHINEKLKEWGKDMEK